MKTIKKNRTKPFVVPVFIPHSGCPHTCIFCNQHTITGQPTRLPDPPAVQKIIDSFLRFHTGGPVQISFYGGTFLGLPKESVLQLLSIASGYVKKGTAESIRFSTRPDSITETTLDMIRPFPVKTIELGVQSLDDDVLEQSGRGHSSFDTVRAAGLLLRERYETGIQLMTGLPGDNELKSCETARRTSELQPDFVRIYPTIVFRGSGLEKLYAGGMYAPLTLERCVETVKKMYLLFSMNGIPVHRMGLQASADFETGESIIAGPYHPAFGHLVFSSLFLDMARLAVRQCGAGKGTVTFFVNPVEVSKMRGLKNSNIGVLMSELTCERIDVKPDESLPLNSVFLKNTLITFESLTNA